MRGQFHPVGDLVEGRFDAVAPLGDDFQQDGGHSRALFLPRRDEDGGAALSLGERGFALMSQRWRVLHRVMVSPTTIGDIAKCVLVLTLFEHKMIS
jgi:hypothetical protein